MSATQTLAPGRDPYRLGHGSGRDRQPMTEHAERGLASKRVIVGYGFWIFLLSDIVMVLRLLRDLRGAVG